MTVTNKADQIKVSDQPDVKALIFAAMNLGKGLYDLADVREMSQLSSGRIRSLIRSYGDVLEMSYMKSQQFRSGNGAFASQGQSNFSQYVPAQVKFNRSFRKKQ